MLILLLMVHKYFNVFQFHTRKHTVSIKKYAKVLFSICYNCKHCPQILHFVFRNLLRCQTVVTKFKDRYVQNIELHAAYWNSNVFTTSVYGRSPDTSKCLSACSSCKITRIPVSAQVKYILLLMCVYFCGCFHICY